MGCLCVCYLRHTASAGDLALVTLAVCLLCFQYAKFGNKQIPARGKQYMLLIIMGHASHLDCLDTLLLAIHHFTADHAVLRSAN